MIENLRETLEIMNRCNDKLEKLIADIKEMTKEMKGES